MSASVTTEFEIAPFETAWDRLRDSWLALFEACGRPCVWYHPAFLDATSALPPDLRPGHILAGYENGALVFALPCWVRSLQPRIRELEFYSGAGFDHLAPLDATPGARASREFYGSFGKRLGLHALRVRNMEEDAVRCIDEAVRGRAALFRRQAFRCPVLPLPKSREALPDALHRSLRKGLQRRLRRAGERGLTYRRIPGPETNRSCTDAVNTLFLLHEQRSSVLGRDSAFSVEPWRGFHIALCRNADRFPGLVQFHEAVVSNCVVATIYGFVAGGVFHDFQGGMSDESGDLSLGNLVRYKAMESLIDDGVMMFDFLRGAEDYKFDWTEECRHDAFVLAGSPGWGRIAVGWLRLVRAVRREGRVRGIGRWMAGSD